MNRVAVRPQAGPGDADGDPATRSRNTPVEHRKGRGWSPRPPQLTTFSRSCLSPSPSPSSPGPYPFRASGRACPVVAAEAGSAASASEAAGWAVPASFSEPGPMARCFGGGGWLGLTGVPLGTGIVCGCFGSAPLPFGSPGPVAAAQAVVRVARLLRFLAPPRPRRVRRRRRRHRVGWRRHRRGRPLRVLLLRRHRRRRLAGLLRLLGHRRRATGAGG